ncbi:MAG: hypothetical protein KatS3mg057_0190 [Herpetosiphonaceae bacterium]|nr:MAG: hypothetical protein KatS3mg057_0190 [Herpetosiphonaceae bacterium]
MRSLWFKHALSLVLVLSLFAACGQDGMGPGSVSERSDSEAIAQERRSQSAASGAPWAFVKGVARKVSTGLQEQQKSQSESLALIAHRVTAPLAGLSRGYAPLGPVRKLLATGSRQPEAQQIRASLSSRAAQGKVLRPSWTGDARNAGPQRTP